MRHLECIDDLELRPDLLLRLLEAVDHNLVLGVKGQLAGVSNDPGLDEPSGGRDILWDVIGGLLVVNTHITPGVGGI